MKKYISLINNERKNMIIKSIKASSLCTTGATDIYHDGVNAAHCTTYAYDSCGKDYAACFDGADDVCINVDTTVCYGPGAEDNT